MTRNPDKNKMLYVTTRQEWRTWLEKHYKSETEVWLVYYKKHSGKPRIPYNDAVEEALCFGWIDSTVKTSDEDSFAQRFSVRKPKSRYSQANKERLRALVKQGKVVTEVLATLEDVLDEEAFEIPPDILKALKASQTAWQNFQGFFASVHPHPHCLHRRGAQEAAGVREALAILHPDDGAEQAVWVWWHRATLLRGRSIGSTKWRLNQRMQPTTLSRIFVKRVSLLWRFGSRFASLRQPRGGWCAVRWVAEG